MSNNESNDSVFDCQTPPDCEVLHQFTHCVNACMRRCGYTRTGLATRMNEALKVNKIEVDEGKLNKWFAPSQPTAMPIHYLPALLWAVKSTEPADILLAPLMYTAVNERALKLKEVSEYEVQIRKLQQEKESLLDDIKIDN
ncbi:hypothetical protein J8M20_23085 [Pseudoalteromonas luteoviolacea]|uniref:hypothetical protein n=1 Tax=Pseudoalteromonas luteoviolacea TaxID=43657 RepID=UPI001B380863|nr:hypothetical protein [Pseudoalteromonas luteoviolacea]MBQ4814271.1 hypothetical protein [Pseudoalteromonas luteoviolacea]